MKKLLFLFLCALFASCSTDLDINAPEKSVLVVYGVMNPGDSVQYVRVAKVFLVDGDAIKYAGETDLSVQNALVKLTEYKITQNSGSTKLIFTEISENQLIADNSNPKEEGTFTKGQTVFRTPPGVTIKPGRYYELEVTVSGNETLTTKAHTFVPSEPFISAPSDKIQVGTGSVLFNYPEIDFYNNYEVRFFKGRKNSTDPNEFAVNGRGYEFRIFLKYGVLNAPNDTSWQPILRFGPGQPFDKSSCSSSSDQILCYRIGAKSYLEFLKSRLSQENVNYVFDDTPLNESCRFEITSVDSALYNYMLVNDPIYSDFTSVKPEYTNFSNGALGIFGSIHTFSRFVTLSQCSKYQAKLNNTPKPPIQCE